MITCTHFGLAMKCGHDEAWTPRLILLQWITIHTFHTIRRNQSNTGNQSPRAGAEAHTFAP